MTTKELYVIYCISLRCFAIVSIQYLESMEKATAETLPCIVSKYKYIRKSVLRGRIRFPAFYIVHYSGCTYAWEKNLGRQTKRKGIEQGGGASKAKRGGGGSLPSFTKNFLVLALPSKDICSSRLFSIPNISYYQILNICIE